VRNNFALLTSTV